MCMGFQETVVLIMSFLCTPADEKRIAVAEKNGIQTIVAGMKKHPASKLVHRYAPHALAVLAADGKCNFKRLALRGGGQA